MSGKIFGAVLIVVGCGGFGFSVTAAVRREEHILRQLLAVLDYIQCELQYRMTPLPDLCRQAAGEHHNRVGDFFRLLSEELESRLSADVSGCIALALAGSPELPKRCVRALEILGTSLGRFDVEGQVRGIEAVRSYCRSELENMAVNRDARLRSYQTLGICAGAALAILFV